MMAARGSATRRLRRVASAAPRVWAVLCLLALAPAARGDGAAAPDPTRRSEPRFPDALSPPDSEPAAAGPDSEGNPYDADDPPLDPHRVEVGLIPVFTANSDEGFGLGVATSIASYEPVDDPYSWRLRALFFMTLRSSVDGALEAPVHDHGAELDLPGLGPTRRLRLRVTGGYRAFIDNYYGMGNGTSLVPDALPGGARAPARYYQYEWRKPYLSVWGRHPLAARLFVSAAFDFHYLWVDVLPGSRLARELDGDFGPTVAASLHGIAPHAFFGGQVGLEWDSRDHEVAPTKGMYHTLVLTGGGGVGDSFAFGGVTLAGRFYARLARGRLLSLAVRVLGDVLFGDAPLVALPSIGGAMLLRGVPKGLATGRARVLANVELRSLLVPFNAFGERMTLGAAAFIDAGRVWADLRPQPALDGRGPGIRYGIGGGLRWLWGEAFILRFDAAWAEEGPGFYLGVDQAF